MVSGELHEDVGERLGAFFGLAAPFLDVLGVVAGEEEDLGGVGDGGEELDLIGRDREKLDRFRRQLIQPATQLVPRIMQNSTREVVENIRRQPWIPEQSCECINGNHGLLKVDPDPRTFLIDSIAAESHVVLRCIVAGGRATS